VGSASRRAKKRDVCFLGEKEFARCFESRFFRRVKLSSEIYFSNSRRHLIVTLIFIDLTRERILRKTFDRRTDALIRAQRYKTLSEQCLILIPHAERVSPFSRAVIFHETNSRTLRM